jgi:hypothetical protein
MEENKNTENKNTGEGTNIGTSTQPAKANNINEGNKQSDTQPNEMLSQRKTESSNETNAVKNLYDKAKESGGQVINQAKEQASLTIGTQKSNLASGLGNVADSIRKVGDNLREGEETSGIVGVTAKYSDTLARQLENLSSYLDRREMKDMMRDLEGFARRNPAVFIGSAFAFGFLAVRFLKSSSPNQVTGTNGKNRSGNGKLNREAPAY